MTLSQFIQKTIDDWRSRRQVQPLHDYIAQALLKEGLIDATKKLAGDDSGRLLDQDGSEVEESSVPVGESGFFRRA